MIGLHTALKLNQTHLLVALSNWIRWCWVQKYYFQLQHSPCRFWVNASDYNEASYPTFVKMIKLWKIMILTEKCYAAAKESPEWIFILNSWYLFVYYICGQRQTSTASVHRIMLCSANAINNFNFSFLVWTR